LHETSKGADPVIKTPEQLLLFGVLPLFLRLKRMAACLRRGLDDILVLGIKAFPSELLVKIHLRVVIGVNHDSIRTA